MLDLDELFIVLYSFHDQHLLCCKPCDTKETAGLGVDVCSQHIEAEDENQTVRLLGTKQ